MPRKEGKDSRLKAAQDAYNEAQSAKADGDLKGMASALNRLGAVLTSEPEPQVSIILNPTKLTLEKRQAFCEILRAGQSVTAAAAAVGVNRVTVYHHRDCDAQFAAEWDAAIESGTDKLEDEAVRRALKVSDTLLIFLLKGRRIQYRDRVNIVMSAEQMDSAIDASEPGKKLLHPETFGGEPVIEQ